MRDVTVVQKDIRLDINLSVPGGMMDYMKGAMRQQQQAGAPSAGPSDPALMQGMAGEYYSYTGSTERKLMLCLNGTFFDSRESSYSGSFGTNRGGWGAATRAPAAVVTPFRATSKVERSRSATKAAREPRRDTSPRASAAATSSMGLPSVTVVRHAAGRTGAARSFSAAV